MITLPNITYNVQEALEYYETVEQKFQHLKWMKSEWLDFVNPNHTYSEQDLEHFIQAVGKLYPDLKWSREQCLEFFKANPNIHRKFTEKAYFWLLKYDATHPKITNDLLFGFAEKIIKVFPKAHTIELIVNPPGTKYNRHVDEPDAFRIIIPIVADAGAVWHFDHASNVTTPPGCAYLLEKHKPHATDNFGDTNRVTIAFLLDPSEFDTVMNLKLSL